MSSVLFSAASCNLERLVFHLVRNLSADSISETYVFWIKKFNFFSDLHATIFSSLASTLLKANRNV